MADSNSATEDVKPPQEAAEGSTSGRRSRAGSSAAPSGDLDLEPSAARKHGLDTSLILNEPRKRAKRESTDGPGVPSASVKGKRKESQQHFDDPAYVLDKGMRLLDAVRDATEGASPECVLLQSLF